MPKRTASKRTSKRTSRSTKRSAKKDRRVLRSDQPLEMISFSFPPIDFQFRFEPRPEDAEFRFNHVEQLLDQAADLLDRGLRAKGEYESRVAQGFNLGLELREFLELDEIHVREEDAGFYDLTKDESQANLGAEEANASGMTELATMTRDYQNRFYNADTLARQIDSRQRSAFMGSLPVHPSQGQDINRFIPQPWPPGASPSLPSIHHLREAAGDQSRFDLESQRDSLEPVIRAHQIAADVSNENIEWLSQKDTWETQNAGDEGFRRQRTQVARGLARSKMNAFIRTGGELNFQEQADAIKLRFDRDFRDAIARLRAAETGLRLLYGFNGAPLPDLTSVFGFDFSLNWARDAISFMVRFLQLDQNYVLPVSVRELLGETEFANGAQSGTWNFAIPETLFPRQRHIRLRGLSVFAELGDREESVTALWQATVQPAREGSFTRHLGRRNRVTLDQSMLPPCRLGRVTSRHSVRDPDVVGTVSLHNASPFGEWSLSLREFAPTQSRIQNLDDVVLDLHLAVRSE